MARGARSGRYERRTVRRVGPPESRGRRPPTGGLGQCSPWLPPVVVPRRVVERRALKRARFCHGHPPAGQRCREKFRAGHALVHLANGRFRHGDVVFSGRSNASDRWRYPGGTLKSFVTSTIAAMVLMVLASDQLSVALALTTQKINFAKLGNKTFGAAPFTVTATASSGLPVSFASTTPGICTVSGSTVTLARRGHVHDPGLAGGQRHLRRGAQRRPELYGRQGQPDDHVHHARQQDVRRDPAHGQRHRILRPAGDLHVDHRRGRAPSQALP